MDFDTLTKAQFIRMGQAIQKRKFKPTTLVNVTIDTERKPKFQKQWEAQTHTYDTIGPPYDPSGLLTNRDDIASDAGKMDIHSNDQAPTLHGHKSIVEEPSWQNWLDTYNGYPGPIKLLVLSVPFILLYFVFYY